MNENTETKPKAKQKDNAFLNLTLNILIPTFIMMKLSKEEYLGQMVGLSLALAFPLAYGIYDLIKASKVNIFSVLGLFSIMVTGGIGLFQLDRTWMIVKETAIPFVLGLFVIASEKSKSPFVRTFLAQVLDLEKINNAYKEEKIENNFQKRLKRSSYMLGMTFFVSAFLNFALATYILKGQPGSEEFVESLGEMTLYSFPVITVPMMAMVGFIIYYLIYGIKKETALELDDIFNQ